MAKKAKRTTKIEDDQHTYIPTSALAEEHQLQGQNMPPTAKRAEKATNITRVEDDQPSIFSKIKQLAEGHTNQQAMKAKPNWANIPPISRLKGKTVSKKEALAEQYQRQEPSPSEPIERKKQNKASSIITEDEPQSCEKGHSKYSIPHKIAELISSRIKGNVKTSDALAEKYRRQGPLCSFINHGVNLTFLE